MVYVAGSVEKPNTACYWKNNIRTNLLSSADSSARAIAVSNGIVHAAGYIGGGSSRACYWKDGVRTELSVPVGVSSDATGLVVIIE